MQTIVSESIQGPAATELRTKDTVMTTTPESYNEVEDEVAYGTTSETSFLTPFTAPGEQTCFL